MTKPIAFLVFAVCVIASRFACADDNFDRAVFYEKMQLLTNGRWGMELNTGYVPNERTIIRAKYKDSGENGTHNLFNCNCVNGSDTNPLYYYCSGFRIPKIGYRTNEISPSNTERYSQSVYEVELKQAVATIRDANGLVVDTFGQLDTDPFDAKYPLYLFTKRRYNSSGEPLEHEGGANADFYYLKIYETNEQGVEVLIHDFAPCKVDETIAIGDRVKETVIFETLNKDEFKNAFKVKEDDRCVDHLEASVTSSAFVAAGGEVAVSASFWSNGAEASGATYTWNFGDGSTPVTTTEKTCKHVYSASGIWTITVTAKKGATTKSVTLENAVTIVNAPQAHGIGNFAKAAVFMVDGYTGASPLADFPVLVRLSENSPVGFHYADMGNRSSGAELRFADENMEVIPCEIDTWNPEGESLVWVKLPELAHGKAFYMFYGGTPKAQNVASDIWTDYVGVWHMGEASGVCEDSTVNNLDATPYGATEKSIGVTGAVGTGRQSATAEAKGWLAVQNYNSVHNGEAFTMSGWVKLSDTESSNQPFFSRNTGSSDIEGWHVGVRDSPSDTFVMVKGSDNDRPTFAQASDFAEWAHLTLVYHEKNEENNNEQNVSIFLNGVKNSDKVVKTIWTYKENGLGFGSTCDGGFANYARASFDELRLRKSPVSDDWAIAEYATQTRADFLLSMPVMSVTPAGFFFIVR